MEQQQEKIYVGRAKYIETRFGKFPRIWLTPEGVEAINANVDNRGGINLEMHELRQPDRGGFTHYLIVDQWRPEQSRGNVQNNAGNRDSKQTGYQNRSGHRYGPEDRNPPEPPRREDVSPEPFSIDDEIPF